jgi:hypothetical protein
MQCSSLILYPLVFVHDLDAEDVRLGQLFVLASGLPLVVAGHLLIRLLAAA